MTYVSGGDVVAKRSPWRLSIVTDMFWGVVNFVGLLYVAECAYYTGHNISQGSTSNRGIGGNGRGGPRRMGGINHRGTINQPMGGGCCG
ncbi:Selenoprotein K [Phytophthora nicotianae]|uniref:Selenoprotein K n=1 Tax=Phytophthora nicotianae TaxID=4792 RepID=A0A0W8DNT0_PHYNI|nr:Selenoprotein K [Phytophthora nicotianae]